jgi:hypothetical protein
MCSIDQGYLLYSSFTNLSKRINIFVTIILVGDYMVCKNNITSGEKIDIASMGRTGVDVKCSGNYPKMDSRVDKAGNRQYKLNSRYVADLIEAGQFSFDWNKLPAGIPVFIPDKARFRVDENLFIEKWLRTEREVLEFVANTICIPSCAGDAAKLDRSKLKEIAGYQIEQVEKTIGKITSVAIGLLDGKEEKTIFFCKPNTEYNNQRLHGLSAIQVAAFFGVEVTEDGQARGLSESHMTRRGWKKRANRL